MAYSKGSCMSVVVKTMVQKLLGLLNTRCRSILRTQKRDHNFDNHACLVLGLIAGPCLGDPRDP